jgi:hypothetical protein
VKNLTKNSRSRCKPGRSTAAAATAANPTTAADATETNASATSWMQLRMQHRSGNKTKGKIQDVKVNKSGFSRKCAVITKSDSDNEKWK